MKNNYFELLFGKLTSTKWLFVIAIIISNVAGGQAQVKVPFTQRTSNCTPTKKIYNIQGDFTMMGNTNMTLQNYTQNKDNSLNSMIAVDADNDDNTSNSSSATLSFSNENGATSECSNVVYAGLYWTGRTKRDVSTAAERTIKIKAPNQNSYQTIMANADDINFPGENNIYAAYTEVTNLVRSNGVGEYWVADMAISQGNGGASGYYGGWGMVVIYENSKMNFRDVTVFNGYAYVEGNKTINYELPVSGFNTAKSGNINLKLGIMAGEGDKGISGDYFDIQKQSDNSWLRLSHSKNQKNNFFNSSIETNNNTRTPNLINNTGIDISMFQVPNENNSVITNNQTSTKFRYGSTQDTYIIHNIVMSVDAYKPIIEGTQSIESINGASVSQPYSVIPG